MTTIKFDGVTETNLEQQSVKVLKDMIKEHSDTTGVALPTGMWKMTKDQLIEYLADIYTDFIDNESSEVEEKVEEKDEEVETKTVKPESKPEEKEEKKKKARRGKITILTLENGEELEFETIVGFHQYMKDNFPEYKSWPMLRAVIRGEENEKSEKFAKSGMKIRLAEGFKHGHKNQYTK